MPDDTTTTTQEQTTQGDEPKVVGILDGGLKLTEEHVAPIRALLRGENQDDNRPEIITDSFDDTEPEIEEEEEENEDVETPTTSEIDLSPEEWALARDIYPSDEAIETIYNQGPTAFVRKLNGIARQKSAAASEETEPDDGIAQLDLDGLSADLIESLDLEDDQRSTLSKALKERVAPVLEQLKELQQYKPKPVTEAQIQQEQTHFVTQAERHFAQFDQGELVFGSGKTQKVSDQTHRQARETAAQFAKLALYGVRVLGVDPTPELEDAVWNFALKGTAFDRLDKITTSRLKQQTKQRSQKRTFNTSTSDKNIPGDNSKAIFDVEIKGKKVPVTADLLADVREKLDAMR